jgi:hypothetical protein
MGIKVTFNKKTIVHEYNTVTNTALTDTPKDNNLIDAQHSKGSQPDTPKDHNSELMSFLIELTGVSKKIFFVENQHQMTFIELLD